MVNDTTEIAVNRSAIAMAADVSPKPAGKPELRKWQDSASFRPDPIKCISGMGFSHGKYAMTESMQI